MPGNDNQKIIIFYTLPSEGNIGKAIVMKLDGDSKEVPFTFYWTPPTLNEQSIKINYFLYNEKSS